MADEVHHHHGGQGSQRNLSVGMRDSEVVPAYDDLSPPSGEVITSTANPRVKHLVELRKRRTRDAEGVTLVDGYDELVLAVDAGVEVRTVFLCLEMAANRADRLEFVDRLAASGVGIVRLGRTAFEKATYRESPDGWLAVVTSPETALADLRIPSNPLVLVAASVEKPGNLGAMLRTAEAAGVDAVIAASPVTDWGNPNVVRASKGTVFAVPIASASSTEVIGWLRGIGAAIVIATPDTDLRVSDLDLSGSVAVVVGAEHAGVSAEWREAADSAGRIPMAGRVNSLNVATSAAVVLFEAVRQRNGS
jgi:TrmH family RNA methyltransferase